MHAPCLALWAACWVHDKRLKCSECALGRCSGDDITNICRDAAMNGMRRNIAGKTPMELKKMKELGQVRLGRE